MAGHPAGGSLIRGLGRALKVPPSTVRYTRLAGGWAGRLGGLSVGGLVAGLPGALLGLGAGSLLDRHRRLAPFAPQRWRHVAAGMGERSFFAVLFGWLGHLAKADGRVSEPEVAATRAVMDEFGFDADARRLAVELFTRGKDRDFPARTLARRLARRVPDREWRLRAVQCGVRVVVADGRPQVDAERRLRRLAELLGIDEAEVGRRLYRARGAGVPSRADALALQGAYDLLGVEHDASDEAVRKAYRRLISRHHPDRMEARRRPAAEIRAAGERTRRIREAFERIRRSRGM
jgi:DnaJ like chaperone protein